MAKADVDMASAPLNLADFRRRTASAKCDFEVKSRARGCAGKVTIDSEEARVWLGAARVILDCLLPYSGTVDRKRISEKSATKVESTSHSTICRSAPGHSWSEFTRDELERIAQDGEMAKAFLQIIDADQK